VTTKDALTSAVTVTCENDPWKVSERQYYRRPIAAPLEECAWVLGDPEAEVRRAAEGIKPYRHADGHPVWSVFLIERALHPERFDKAKAGAPTRRRGANGRRSAA
jgi:hypothetical protein